MRFWEYRSGKATGDLSDKLSGILEVKKERIFLLENGRTGQYIFLKSLKFPEGTKIAIQGFTCNAVVNPVLWLNLEPLYIDIEPETLNIDFEDLYSKIDKDTKMVVLQHTFGNPAFKTKKDFENFIAKMHEKGIIVFEDCAHALGGEIEGKKIGTFGDAALFSFGIEKVLATRVGGALVVNDEKYIEEINEIFAKLRPVGFRHTFVWLLNPFFWRILRNAKRKFKYAKILRKFGLLYMGFEESELSGRMPKYYPRKISNALSKFVLEELKKLESNLSHRSRISAIYDKNFSKSKNANIVEHSKGVEIPFVRYPILCETGEAKKSLLRFLTKKKVNVGNWYEPIIYPERTELGCMKYFSGTCPKAENVAKRILNLPTGKHINQDLAKNISSMTILYLQNHESIRNNGKKNLG